MRETDLLQMALGLLLPWLVVSSTFDAAAKRLDIHLDFRRGSGFTLLFEALAMTMMTSLPVAAVRSLIGEHDTRLWRVLHHYVDATRSRADYSRVTRVAFDETAARRGHDYVSLFVDLDGPRVLFVADGKDAATVEKFAADLAEHGGAADNVSEVCIDMSAAFIKGTAAHLPNANITFDKFHAVKIINDAVDLVRHAEQKGRPELQKTRYIWLKNRGNLSEAQLDALGGLTDLNLKTARAYQIRLTFQDLYAQSSREAAEAFLKSGTSGPPTRASSRSARPPGPSSATGTVSSAGSTARSPMASSKASTASSRPPKPRPGATAQPATSRRYLPDRRAPGNQATHLKQRGTIILCPFQYPQSAEP